MDFFFSYSLLSCRGQRGSSASSSSAATRRCPARNRAAPHPHPLFRAASTRPPPTRGAAPSMQRPRTAAPHPAIAACFRCCGARGRPRRRTTGSTTRRAPSGRAGRPSRPGATGRPSPPTSAPSERPHQRTEEEGGAGQRAPHSWMSAGRAERCARARRAAPGVRSRDARAGSSRAIRARCGVCARAVARARCLSPRPDRLRLRQGGGQGARHGAAHRPAASRLLGGGPGHPEPRRRLGGGGEASGAGCWGGGGVGSEHGRPSPPAWGRPVIWGL